MARLRETPIEISQDEFKKIGYLSFVKQLKQTDNFKL